MRTKLYCLQCRKPRVSSLYLLKKGIGGYCSAKCSSTGRVLPLETRLKISKSNKGKKKPPFTEEHKRNIALAGIGNSNAKGNLSRLGRPHLESTKIKIGIANTGEKNGIYGKYGELNPNWQGGGSLKPYSSEFNNKLKVLIRERDSYSCQLCDKHENENKGRQRSHHVHHIDYNKANSDPENLITLCKECHMKTNGNREYWKQYFNSPLSSVIGGEI